MRLSEAIRLGAMLRPRQAFWTLYEPDIDATCALGAAADAIGILDTTTSNAFIVRATAPQEWRGVATRLVDCPVCEGPFDPPPAFGYRACDVQSAIVHLNNDHRWSRERIADWVETLEGEASKVTAMGTSRGSESEGVAAARESVVNVQT